MKYAFVVFALLSLTSCATIFNKKEQQLHFYSDTNQELLKINDSIYPLPLDIQVLRSKEDLKVDLVNDSLSTEYTVLSETDPLFVVGNMFTFVGYFVDLNNDKRFYYKDNIYLDPNSTTKILGSRSGIYNRRKRIERSFFNKKGDTFLHFTYAPLNYMSFDLPEFDSRKSSVGTWFGDIGGGYYYADNRFVSLGLGVNMTAHIVPMEYHPVLVSLSLKAMHFYEFKRFNVGYGVYTARNFYREEIEPNIQGEKNIILTGSQTTIGAVLSTNYKISNTFSIGMSYLSSVYRFTEPAVFASNHVVSIELIRKIRLRKKVQN